VKLVCNTSHKLLARVQEQMPVSAMPARRSVVPPRLPAGERAGAVNVPASHETTQKKMDCLLRDQLTTGEIGEANVEQLRSSQRTRSISIRGTSLHAGTVWFQCASSTPI